MPRLRWTHSMCEACWALANPGEDPLRIRQEFREKETCCFCGVPTVSGIYVREAPEKALCGGKHE